MVGHGSGDERQQNQDGEENDDRRDGSRPAHRMRQAHMIGRRRAAKQNKPDHGAKHDGADLSHRGRQRHDDNCCHHSQRRTLAIWSERAHHRQNRLCDDRDGRNHQPVQPAAVQGIVKRRDAIAEQHQSDRRGKGESRPCCQRAQIAGARQSDGDTHFAAGGPGQKLAQRDEIDVCFFIEPSPAYDEFLVEITEMRNRSAEACQSEPQKHGQDLAAVAASCVCLRRKAAVLAHRPHC